MRYISKADSIHSLSTIKTDIVLMALAKGKFPSMPITENLSNCEPKLKQLDHRGPKK
jgi:hypothetical protein